MGAASLALSSEQLATYREQGFVLLEALIDGASLRRWSDRFEDLVLGRTPHPEGLVVMELEVEHSSIVNSDGAAGPIIGRRTVQTTIAAKYGQTTVIGGMMRRAEEGHRQLIIAATPQVNPSR